ncbi:MAG: hypothetical protein QOJ16_3894 [Acidobacteriota bacterium]|nr:hypothetical protein [Acidobacteriota bacterium]
MSEPVPPADPPAHPRYLDVVMKGGITSGVVYPLAVAELAKVFRFRSIGGTSAGAIAAAATAAAEHGRQTGRGSGFAGLADLPRRLTEILPDGRSRLLSLFQPAAATAPLLAVLLAAVRAKGTGAKAAAILDELRQSFPEGFWLGALPGLVPTVALAVVLLTAPHSRLGCLGLVLALLCSALLALAGALLGSLALVAGRAVSTLPANAFGLCRGLADPGEGHPEAPPLTPWLADLLDELAGKDPADGPLTFGDLWKANPPADAKPGERSIDLQVMTTCVSLGRPYRIPFERVFHFKRSELARFFPEPVVQWMVDHAHEDRRLTHPTHDGEPLFALPDAANLPVVFAARLSLSFPILLSAVPLYAVDPAGSRPKDAAEPADPPLARCWFSDGGLTSNLPIHFFDAPLPAWPTVAIDLVDASPAHPLSDLPADNIWLPQRNNGGALEGFQHFDQGSGAKQVLGFVSSLLTAMQNWRDNALSRLPGQRDRIAHVILAPDEGGLNLEMSKELVDGLTERGRWAGIKLRHRFAGLAAPADGLDDKLSWDNHRWVRYLEAMPALQDLLAAFARVYDHPNPGEPTYRDLIQHPPSYKERSQAQKQRLAEVSEKLAEIGRELDGIVGTPADFHKEEPHPPGELKVRPRI